MFPHLAAKRVTSCQSSDSRNYHQKRHFSEAKVANYHQVNLPVLAIYFIHAIQTAAPSCIDLNDLLFSKYRRHNKSTYKLVLI